MESMLDTITELVMKVRNYLEPSEINCGDCWMWAILAHKKLENSKVFYAKNRQDFGHAFVFFNGKYYDCECKEGVDSWEKLRYFVLSRASSGFPIQYFLSECNNLSFLAETWAHDHKRDIKDLNTLEGLLL